MSEKSFLDYAGLSLYNQKIQNEISKIESIPAGVILAYNGAAESIPSGWALCDGQNGTPDLRGRFILGANDSHISGESGGSETHTITLDELPSHDHTVSGVTILESTTGGSVFSGGENELLPADSTQTSRTGGGEPINIMPPYYVLVYIMKLAMAESLQT